MKIYLEKIEPELKDEINDVLVAQEIISLRQNGAPKDYKGFQEGEKLPKEQILGIVLHGKDATVTVNNIWNEVEKEKHLFESVSPLDFKDEADYKNELIKQKKYLDETKWIAGMKAYYEVKSFSELKIVLTPVEPVIDDLPSPIPDMG